MLRAENPYPDIEQALPMSKKLRTLILPGLGNSGPDHWQSLWERQDSSCQRVEQNEWDAPRCEDWVASLDAAVAERDDPAVLVAHSAACALVMHWMVTASAPHRQRIRGALLVSPADPDGPNFPEGPTGFGPMPLHRLPFPSVVVASTDDPYIDAPCAKKFAEAWGSRFVLLQAAGHVNASSGLGSWPQGFALLDSLRGVQPAD